MSRFTSIFIATILFLLLNSVGPLMAQHDHIHSHKNTNPVVFTEAGLNALADIATQHSGRIKPLDTVARAQLLTIYERSTWNDKSALEWLMHTMLTPDKAYDDRVFKIRNKAVINALGITKNDENTYSFNELSNSIRPLQDDIVSWAKKNPEDRSVDESQLVELYYKSLGYLEISRSLTCFERDIVIHNPELSAFFKLKQDQPVSYFQLMDIRGLLMERIASLQKKQPEEFDESDKALGELIRMLQNKQRDQVAEMLDIIPPADPALSPEWLSPWQLLDGRQTSEQQVEYMALLEEAFDAIRTGDESTMISKIKTLTGKISVDKPIATEVNYNRANYFKNSLVFYILSFLLLTLSWMIWESKLRWAAFSCLSIGAVIHTIGIVQRMYIMNRPPVATLYESIIFVGLVIVISGIVIDLIMRNGIGIFSAAVSGIILHFIGFRYALDGDTMGMLVAVLNSRFWLGTHVLTITIGYGAAFIAGMVGHAFIVIKIIQPGNIKRLGEVYRNAIGLSLVALFFTTLGTILGGIWADDSWGRFWGWDPKENGALLIVLWLLLILHGRVSKVIGDNGFAVGLVIANIIVALAWFGVNLLGVGLHSYGFTDSIAFNLLLFCSFEMLFGVVGYGLIKFREKKLA